jgi:hypothetical protein
MVFFNFLWVFFLVIVLPLLLTHHHTVRPAKALTINRMSEPRSLRLGLHLWPATWLAAEQGRVSVSFLQR